MRYPLIEKVLAGEVSWDSAKPFIRDLINAASIVLQNAFDTGAAEHPDTGETLPDFDALNAALDNIEPYHNLWSK